MIGFVVVSHSEPLAAAAVDLAMQMIHGEAPPVRVAAGADGGFGTDAVAIAAAIDELAGTDGVLILTDLGSAVLSSELALELRESTQPVRISGGPFVEGATAGIVRAATGGTLDEVAAEAAGALAAKQPHGDESDAAPGETHARERICGARTDEHRHRPRHGGDQQRVAEPAEVGILRVGQDAHVAVDADCGEQLVRPGQRALRVQ